MTVHPLLTRLDCPSVTFDGHLLQKHAASEVQVQLRDSCVFGLESWFEEVR